MTDENGQVVMDQDYLVFGEDLLRPGLVESESSYETEYGYTGQYKEEAIGLYYYKARFYNPGMGRFITEDSYKGELVSSQSQNVYIYVLQNPFEVCGSYGA